MKGSLKIVSVSDHLSKTNFNDWSDPKYKLPPRNQKRRTSPDESSDQLEAEPDTSEISVESTVSQTDNEISEMRNRIREGHPLMTKKEIRNFRLPFYESLLLNLKEDGFLLTHEFIKDLIAIDDAYHKDLEKDFNLKNRPILKLTKSVLVPLTSGLKKAETSRLDDNKNEEATAFLDLANLFSNSNDPSWYWIALEMFEQSMEVINNVEKPVDLQLQATAKYLYALFLFDELHELNEARTQTEASMSISESKYWTIGDTKEKKGIILYIASSILLHKIFLEMAERELMNQNSEEAIYFCRNSLLWAKVMNNKPAEIDALQKLINIYLTVQQLFSVPELLASYMKLCTELENYEGLCEGFILRARYHDSVGEVVNVIEDMNNLLKVAKENHITKMVAMAHHKLATYCLLRGSEEFLEHSIEAYMSYLNLKKNFKDTEEARCLVGVAQGQEIMTEFCSLVFDADNYNIAEQMILFRWKNLRIPFFDCKFEFIPEIVANEHLLDKAEKKKNEELLAHVQWREAELVSMSSKRQSLFLSTKQQSQQSGQWPSELLSLSLNRQSIFNAPKRSSVFHSMYSRPSSSDNDSRQLSREKNFLVKEPSFQLASLKKSDETNKSRTVSFRQDY